MRKLICMLILVLSVGTITAHAEKSEAPKATENKSQTSHNFEDLLVQGKYHFTDEAVSTVEEDKVLDSLLGMRADFKDRMVQSAEQF
jgi:hypothetical protein